MKEKNKPMNYLAHQVQSLKNEGLIDLKVSLTLYKTNFKAFLSAQLISILIFLVSQPQPWDLTVTFPGADIPTYDPVFTSIFFSIRYLIGSIVLSVFFGCSFGLSYEIMSSGNLFTKFIGLFHYFRRYWWQYIILFFLLTFGPLIYSSIAISMLSPLVLEAETLPYVAFSLVTITITEYIFNLFWMTLFLQMYPSLTARGGIKRAFSENWHLFRCNSKRIFISLLLFFLIFKVPWIIADILDIIGMVMRFYLYSDFWQHWSHIHYFAQTIIYFFLEIPVLALISTRIYNSLTYVASEVDEKK